MKNALIPYEISVDEWIISCPDIFPAHGYEQFSNRTYPTREACQKAIDRLYSSLHDLLEAAFEIVDAWQDGNLGRAVRDLAEVLETAWASG